MKTEIYVISGFLGAGKTTLIQKLLREAFSGDRVALVENDFGEISVDSALLRSGGVEVREMNSGCICCSLSGDFVKGMLELLDKYKPSKIIIEPSGVGKLSDIEAALSDPKITASAKLSRRITVADVKRCKMYLDNFGEFFEDQIERADAVVLSRTQLFPDRVDGAVSLVRGINPRAVILTAPWDTLAADDILNPAPIKPAANTHSHLCKCGCGKVHTHSDTHGEACSHDHGAEDSFDTVTIHTDRVFTPEQIRLRVSGMEKAAGGTVLRAKGIVRGGRRYLNVQYLPGEVSVTECDTPGDAICVIGTDLDGKALSSLFGGD